MLVLSLALSSVQNWTEKLDQAEQENLSVCSPGTVHARRSHCAICASCSSTTLTHVQLGTTEQSFRSFSGVWLSRQSFPIPYLSADYFCSCVTLCICPQWTAPYFFHTISPGFQPCCLPSFPSHISLLEAPCLTALLWETQFRNCAC